MAQAAQAASAKVAVAQPVAVPSLGLAPASARPPTSRGQEPEGNTQNTPADILKPGGKPVGEVVGGASDDVRTVTPEKLDEIADRLKGLGAKLNPDKNYPGDWYDLPDGKGGLGIRISDDHGKTIDIQIPEVPEVHKIHQR